jgi:hydroxyacylglutathione hydrolase
MLRQDGALRLSRLVLGPLSTNTYLVTCARTGDTAVVDPADDEPAIAAAVDGGRVVAVVLTHAHWDHVQAVDAVRARWGVPVLAHAAEHRVWAHERAHLRAHGQWDWALEAHRAPSTGAPPVPGWDGRLDRSLSDGDTVRVGDLDIGVLHTPGHTPGSLSLVVGDDVLTGDTLFPGGPGLTGWPLSDFATIIESVATRLLALPEDVAVRPGHGPSTTVRRERPHLDDWRSRGW